MEINIERIYKSEKCTIGKLSVNGTFQCNTLEDPVRELPEDCPNTPRNIDCKCDEKVYGNTAIPEGTYKLILSYSNRFKKVMPEILNVPHFRGVRIHKGNSAADTDACILVGTWNGTTDNWIASSKIAYDKLYALLKNARDNKEEITITISNV